MLKHIDGEIRKLAGYKAISLICSSIVCNVESVKSHGGARNGTRPTPPYLLNSRVSTHKLRGDCGHVAARIARTESKTERDCTRPGGWFL